MLLLDDTHGTEFMATLDAEGIRKATIVYTGQTGTYKKETILAKYPWVHYLPKSKDNQQLEKDIPLLCCFTVFINVCNLVIFTPYVFIIKLKA